MKLSFRHQVALLVALSMVGAVGPLLVFYERDLHRGVLSDRVQQVVREARDLESNENVLVAAQARDGREELAAELREEAAEFIEQTGAVEVLFTDAGGTIVGHSDPRRIGDSDPEAALKRRVIRSGRTLSVEEEKAGVTYYEIVAPVDLGGGRRLALEIEDDMSELNSAMSQARRAGLLPSVLALVIALPAAAILTTRFVDSARRREQQVEARFRSLVQEASDVIVVIDASGRTTFVSPAVKRVLGYAPEERVGKKALDLVHPSDLDTVNKLFSDVSKAPGATATAEARVRHRDGSWRWIEGTATNLLADPNVGGIVLNYRDVGERKALEEGLTHRAFHDSMTNLANRELFKDRVEHALSLRKVRGDSVAVLFIDLDDFKNVNDSLGHAAGDLLLVAVAERLRESLRPSDTLGRLGGDEFGVLLEDMQHPADAVLIAERITETLHKPFDLSGRQVLMHASIGIVADLSLDETADELVKNADTAMYAAKTEGKGSYAIYEPHMHEALLRRQALKGELQRALERDEFTLRYQPIVALGPETVVGVEALVRWRHPSAACCRRPSS
jgi:diguanylate cyclase (GGDEF)-like protein/PAS domain S-box-containing protein